MKKLAIAGLIGVGVLAVVGMGVLSFQTDETPPQEQLVQSEDGAVESDAAYAGAGEDTSNVEEIEPAAASEGGDTPVESAEPAELSEAELEAALEERVLGDAGAPVTISEHSSFTCGHCGNFHKNTFKPFKEAYIDTGKVKLIFSDFPLNGPALHASAVARCVEKDKYFDFVQLLFETQDQWAYSQDYKAFLKQNAQMIGMSSERFEACFSSEALQEGLLAAVKETQAKHEISSTPSFVINDDEVVTGALSFEAFSKTLDEALKASDSP